MDYPSPVIHRNVTRRRKICKKNHDVSATTLFEMPTVPNQALQPTAPRRYLYGVDARAAREYWSIKTASPD
jgi:hypothetical protein